MKRYGMIVLVVVALASCSSGTSDGSASGIPVSVSGPMQKGSILVGGIVFDDSSTEVSADEVAQAVTYIEDGMTIRLLGTVDASGTTGTATLVEVENELRGPIDSLDGVAKTLTVFGFTVVTDSRTVYDEGDSFSDLAVGETVEVYGFQYPDGHIRATRIDEVTADDLEIRGIVSEKSGTDSGTFRVGGSTTVLSYNETTVIDDGTSFAVGDLVEVELDVDLTALRIELEDAEDQEFFPDEVGTETEIEGVISAFTAHPGSFRVGAVLVETNAATEFDGGDATRLRNGLVVEVEGHIAGTTLVAEEVEFDESFEAVGNAASAESADLFGLTVSTTALTELDGLASFTDIAAGDGIRIAGFSGSSGNVEAIEVERLSEPVADDEFELQGPIEAVVSDTSVRIAGVLVDLSQADDFTEDDGEDIDESAFFSRLDIGVVIEVEGDYDSGVFSALEAELEE